MSIIEIEKVRELAINIVNNSEDISCVSGIDYVQAVLNNKIKLLDLNKSVFKNLYESGAGNVVLSSAIELIKIEDELLSGQAGPGKMREFIDHANEFNKLYYDYKSIEGQIQKIK